MKSNRGIALATLVITVIVLAILAGVTVGFGSSILRDSELQNLKTNMLLIETKAKEHIENANFDLGINPTDEQKAERREKIESELVGTRITDGSIFNGNVGITTEQITSDYDNFIYYYKLTTANLEEMGLKDLKSDDDEGWYIVKYDIQNDVVEIYNTKGFTRDEETAYSLTELELMRLR